MNQHAERIEQQLQQNLWTPANFVSGLRIPLGLGFPFLAAWPAWELVFLLLGAFSDFLDGWLARKMGQAGGLGAIIDPICDKFFLLMVALSYALHQRLPWWVLLIVISRDIYILLLSGILRLSGHWRKLHVSARAGGKVVTALQLLYFCLLTLKGPSGVLNGLLWALGLLSLLASADYTWEVSKQLRERV